MKKNKSLITIAILVALSAVLDLFAVVSFPGGFHTVSSFYLSAAFYMLFVYVWGWKGIISIYFGMILASLFGGFSLFPLYGAWGNTLGAALIVYGMKLLKCSCEIENWKDLLCISLFFLLASAFSGAWVLGGWVLVGIIPAEAFISALFTWWLGDVIVYFIFGLALMKFVAPLAKRFNLV